MERYYTQLVCMNGHQVTDRLETYSGIKNYCKDCGSKTISTCQNCSTSITGDYEVPGVVALGFETPVPSYCPFCGEAYPWTSKIIENAVELVAIDNNLDEHSKSIIKNTLPDLLVETPTTPVAANKFKMVMEKASNSIKDGMYNLLVDTVSETVKKVIFE